METRRLSKEYRKREEFENETNEKERGKWNWKDIIYPKFESKLIEKKFLRSYLEKIYPSSHRLLVFLLTSHGLINLIERFLFHSFSDRTNLIHLILFSFSICLNLLSLIFLHRQRIRSLSILTSIICLFPLTVLSILNPNECHIYFLIILFYTLTNFPLIISLICSLSTIISIIILEQKFDRRYILFILIHFIGIYLNRLLEITTRSAYDQLCKSKR